MPIPKYDEMYLAFLECLADGQTHKSKEVKDAVADILLFLKRNEPNCCQVGNRDSLITVLAGHAHI